MISQKQSDGRRKPSAHLTLKTERWIERRSGGNNPPVTYLRDKMIQAGASILLLLISGCASLTLPEASPGVPPGNAAITNPAPPTATPFPPDPTPTPTITPSPTSSPTPSPSPTPLPLRTQYDIRVRFDPAAQSLEVKQSIGYVNRSNQALSELMLVVDPNLQSRVFELGSPSWENGEPVQDYILDRSVLEIPLTSSLAPGERVGINIDYRLRLPYKIGGFGYNERETILIDWYPFIPPYHEENGWQVNRPWPHGEYLEYEWADYLVRIRTEGDSANAPVIAGPVPPIVEGAWSIFRLNSARSFAWSASNEYDQETRISGETTIWVYFFPEHRNAAQAGLDIAERSLLLYEELYGPYGRAHYTIVEAAYSDGAEADGLIFLSYNYHAEFNQSARNFYTLLVAHETAHQWWYGKVGNDPANEPWLDEALATYSEALYYERYHPELLDWWWFFRVDYFRPKGAVNGQLYDFGTFFPYVHAVYLRGAHLLQDLREQMGDEAFFRFLHAYATNQAGLQVTSDDFLRALEAVYPAGYEEVLSRYFSR